MSLDDLAVNARKGCNHAFELIEAELRRRFDKMSSQTTGDASKSDDLFQEWILKVWNSLGRFKRSRAHFENWVMGIFRRARINFSKRETRRMRRFATNHEGLGESAEVHDDPAALAVAKQRAQRVTASVASMPNPDQLILRMKSAMPSGRKSTDMTSVQIAAALKAAGFKKDDGGDIIPAYVDQLYKRALERLKQSLEKCNDR